MKLSLQKKRKQRFEEGVVDDREVTEDQIEDNIEPDEEIENADRCGLGSISVPPLEFIVACMYEGLDVIVTLRQCIETTIDEVFFPVGCITDELRA